MTRTTATIPRELERFLEGAVEIGAFSSKSEVVQEAICSSFENDHLRIAAVLSLYEEGTIDSEEALELADVKDKEIRGILMDELDVEPEEAEVSGEDILQTIYDDFSIDLDDE